MEWRGMGGGRYGHNAVSLLLLWILFLFNGITAFNPKIRGPAMLTKDDMLFLFHDKEAPSQNIINIKARSREKRSTPSLTTEPGYLDLTLQDQGQDLEFELRPNLNLISPNFVFVLEGKDGVEKHHQVGKASCLYYGNAKNKPNTMAAFSNCDGRGFTGVIISGNETHLVRPFNRTGSRRKRQTDETMTTDGGLHIIDRRRSDSKCGVHDIKAMTAPRERSIIELDDVKERKKRATNDKPLQIETGVFVDDDLYKLMKEDAPESKGVDKLNDVVLTIMNGVNLLFNAPSLDLHFTITIVRIHVIKSPDKGPNKQDGDIQLYLNTFCRWQRLLNQSVRTKGEEDPWDHGLMLSGLDLYDGLPKNDEVIGLAWVSGMCHPLYSCTINEGTSFEAVYVIAHEMGHNLGMTHDGTQGNKCDGNKFLMSASTGPGKVTWSSCSNNELDSFVREYGMNCLDYDSYDSRGPRKLELDLSELPGEKFGSDKQCIFAEGSNFKPYVTSKSPYNAVCRELWCQNTTHALRTHPALQGTSCGRGREKKHCISGQCVKKMNPNSPTRAPTTTSTTTTTTTTQAPSRGISGLLHRIRDLFRRYLFLRKDGSGVVKLMSKWKLTMTTPCSVECGGGWQEGRVTCMGSDGQEEVSENHCDSSLRPPPKTSCNTSPCTATSALNITPLHMSLPPV